MSRNGSFSRMLPYPYATTPVGPAKFKSGRCQCRLTRAVQTPGHDRSERHAVSCNRCPNADAPCCTRQRTVGNARVRPPGNRNAPGSRAGTSALGLATMRDLQCHPVAGAEIDLPIERVGGKPEVAIHVNRAENAVAKSCAHRESPDAQSPRQRATSLQHCKLIAKRSKRNDVEASRTGHRRAAADPVGAEIDLVIEHWSRKIGVEIKFSSAPKPAKGFWQALQDLPIEHAYVVAPVPRR